MTASPGTVHDDLTNSNGLEADQQRWLKRAPSSEDVRVQVKTAIAAVLALVEGAAGSTEYERFEVELIKQLFAVGRLLVVLFLTLCQERTPTEPTLKLGRATYRRKSPRERTIGTFFGKVVYWRTYVHKTNGRGGGFFPVDRQLGLTADGFTLGLLGRAVKLATMMSYAAAVSVMASFLRWSPSTKTIERATLGLGGYTGAWFEEQAPPPDDGEVLVVQIDSKATPTATDGELAKRRGKRKPNPFANSPRHRGRQLRQRRGPRKRKKKGDKSKNGKMATMVVMYTLGATTDDEGAPVLLGPINRRVYASYAPKRHAFAIARREADKRGFTSQSGNLIQLVTDGDDDLERYAGEYFPEAIHTLDVVHAIEYLWNAACCLFPEGSERLIKWYEEQKKRLYDGATEAVLEELNKRREQVKSKDKRKRLAKTIGYIDKRTHMMNYDELAAEDLELGSGAVEGAVRYVISQRFDEGGMRWIKERAESLLQLRCIEINGDWDDFLAFVHGKLAAASARSPQPPRLLQDQANPLPTLGVAA